MMEYKDTSRAEAMRRHIEACKAGKQTVVAYCKEHQLALSRFYYWQKRLCPASVKPSFTQVPLPTIDTSAVIIHFPHGVRIAFSGSVSTSVLKELVCCI